jgi:hypothetical protein
MGKRSEVVWRLPPPTVNTKEANPYIRRIKRAIIPSGFFAKAFALVANSFILSMVLTPHVALFFTLLRYFS